MGILWSPGSESILQQFRSYHQEITHSGQSPWQMYGSSRNSWKPWLWSFTSAHSCPLSQKLHNKQTGLPWVSTACLAVSPLAQCLNAAMKSDHLWIQTPHVLLPRQLGPWSNVLLRLIQNTRKPQKRRTLCHFSPSHVAYGRSLSCGSTEWRWKPGFLETRWNVNTIDATFELLSLELFCISETQVLNL